MSVSAFPTIFVQGPIPERTISPHNGRDSFDLAYQLTNDLNKEPSTRVLNAFLAENPDFYLDSVGRVEWTAMAVAINKKALPLIRAILDRDPSIADSKKSYLLDASGSFLEMVQIFLEKGADINQHRNAWYGRGITPLHHAINKQDDKLAQFLLLRGGIVYEEARKTVSVKELNFDNEQYPAYIDRIIQKIDREYRGSVVALVRSLHSSKSKSFFSKLPQDASSLVSQFRCQEAPLIHKLFTRLKLVRSYISCSMR